MTENTVNKTSNTIVFLLKDKYIYIFLKMYLIGQLLIMPVGLSLQTTDQTGHVCLKFFPPKSVHV